MSYTLHKIFVTYTQTDRHFPEIIKSYLGRPKTKSIKKTEVENLHETNAFFYLYRSKNLVWYTLALHYNKRGKKTLLAHVRN